MMASKYVNGNTLSAGDLSPSKKIRRRNSEKKAKGKEVVKKTFVEGLKTRLEQAIVRISELEGKVARLERRQPYIPTRTWADRT